MAVSIRRAAASHLAHELQLAKLAAPPALYNSFAGTLGRHSHCAPAPHIHCTITQKLGSKSPKKPSRATMGLLRPAFIKISHQPVIHLELGILMTGIGSQATSCFCQLWSVKLGRHGSLRASTCLHHIS